MKIGRHKGPTRRRRWAGGALSVLVIALIAWAPGVGAQTGDDLKVMLDRLQRLERDIRTLNVQISRGGTAPVPATGAKTQPPPGVSVAPREPLSGGPAMARLGVRLAGLEEDIRAVTGSMEEFGFLVGEIRKRLDTLVADMDYRLGALENRAFGAPVAQGRTPGRTPAQRPPAPRLSAAPQPPPVQKVMPGQGGGFAAPPGSLGTVSQRAVSSVRHPPPGNGTKPAVSEAAPGRRRPRRCPRRRLGRPSRLHGTSPASCPRAR